MSGAAIILALHFVAAQVTPAACHPSDITQAEARILALNAAETIVVPASRHHLAAELDTVGNEQGVWLFRVRATNTVAVGSALVGWFAVNKRTAVLSDPVIDPDAPVPYDIPALAPEQTRLRAVHCLD